MKPIFIFILLISVVLAEEPSVFEIQSNITKKEVENLTKTNNQQSDKIFNLENKIKELETSIEGLKSIYEGYSNNLKELNDKVNDLSNKYEDKEKNLNKLKEDVANNTNNIQTIKDSIDSNLSQIQELLTNELKQKDKNIKENTENIIDSNNTIKNETKDITNKELIFNKDIKRKNEIFKEARSLTYSKKFDEAIERYKWLIEINYKKAESYYMLGNIAYEQNKYNDAIYYFKESATLDDKAKYMPRLLLNSANSFRVLNDKDNANKFYTALLNLFPDSDEAKEAKKYIK